MLLSIRPTTPVSVPVKPRVRFLNPAFVYRNASNTNIRDTFDRIRAERAAQAGK